VQVVGAELSSMMRMAVVKIKHVVEKCRHVLIERESECFCLVEVAIYLLIVRFYCSRILEVQILYLSERARCYGRQIYAFNQHKKVQKWVIRRNIG
jgi:hypothetical protein